MRFREFKLREAAGDDPIAAMAQSMASGDARFKEKPAFDDRPDTQGASDELGAVDVPAEVKATSDHDLRNEIIKLLKTEEDREMLDKIFVTLNNSTLNDRIKEALSDDADTKGKLDLFAGMILSTHGSFDEINNFLENFDQGFIDVKRLKTPNGVTTFDDWIVGGRFAKEVFKKLYPHIDRGIGTGEYALSVMSPDIQFAGRSSDIHGDLLIQGEMVELKSQISAGGRFFDERKAGINVPAIEKAFAKEGIVAGEGLVSSYGLSTTGWTKVRKTLDPKVITKLVNVTVSNLFPHTGKSKGSGLRKALTNGDHPQIKHEWGMLSYYEYKSYSKFESMILMNMKSETSLYFSDIKDVSESIKSSSGYLFGPSGDIMPQMSFKI